jgi:hypothetical protein
MLLENGLQMKVYGFTEASEDEFLSYSSILEK